MNFYTICMNMRDSDPAQTWTTTIAVGFDLWHSAFGHQIVQGIRAYADEHAKWQLRPSPLAALGAPSHPAEPPSLGAIAQLQAQPEPHLLDVTIPVVVVGIGAIRFGHDRPAVIADYEAMGRRAAEDLGTRGMSSLALFCADRPEAVDIDLIERGFVVEAEAYGVPVAVHRAAPRSDAEGTAGYNAEVSELGCFLAKLPKPIGLACRGTPYGWRALAACRRSHLGVPNDVAVLAIGDNTFTCEIARPTLSSITIDQFGVGYTAAKLLHQQLEGERVPDRTFVSFDLISRQSTDHLAVADADVKLVLAYIRDHLSEDLTVERLAEVAAVSRSTLLHRFREELGRSPSEEVRRQRIAAALTMIRFTDTPLTTVARQTGFGQQAALGRTVKQVTGKTPLQVRREHR